VGGGSGCRDPAGDGLKADRVHDLILIPRFAYPIEDVLSD